jgi:hypothetical protein
VPGRLLAILCAALLLASGCGGPDNDRRDVLKTLAVRAGALNARDISRYISVVSPRYHDKDKDLARLKASLENNFKDYEQIAYEAGTPSITVSGKQAESVCGYRMKIKMRGKEMTLNGTEHLRMTKEPEGWKITSGL